MTHHKPSASYIDPAEALKLKSETTLALSELKIRNGSMFEKLIEEQKENLRKEREERKRFRMRSSAMIW